ADCILQVLVALLFLERRIREIARPRIEVEGVEAIARAGLAVAGLAVVDEDHFSQSQLVAGSRHLGGSLRPGRSGPPPVAWERENEQEAGRRAHPHFGSPVGGGRLPRYAVMRRASLSLRP